MDIDTIKKVVREWAASETIIKEAYIFGSRVFGEYRKDSDLDVAVKVFTSQECLDDVAMQSGIIEKIYESLENSEDLTWSGERERLRQNIIEFFKKHSTDFKPHLTSYYAEYVEKTKTQSGLILVFSRKNKRVNSTSKCTT